MKMNNKIKRLNHGTKKSAIPVCPMGHCWHATWPPGNIIQGPRSGQRQGLQSAEVPSLASP